MLVHSWDMIKRLNPDLPDNYKQQNATDFSCDGIKEIVRSIAHPRLLKNRTIHSEKVDLPLTKDTDSLTEGWYLKGGRVYETVSNVWVEIPEGTAGLVVHRSSLNRNGVQVVSALWDAGFNGNLNAVLYVHNPNGIFIEKGARIAQFYLMESQTLGLYEGQYQSEKRS